MERRGVWAAVAAGGAVGLVLGLATGYFGRSPLFGGSGGDVVFPIGIGMVAVVTLAVWAAVRRSRAALGALVAMVTLGVVGVGVAPTPPGGFTSGSGSVSIGSPASPTADFQGPARCEYEVGGPYVTDIGGFSWAVSDPALFEAFDLAGPASVDNVHLGTGARPIGSEADVEFAEGQEARSGSFVAFDLLSVAPDGTSGTARSKDGAVVISWTCASGPPR